MSRDRGVVLPPIAERPTCHGCGKPLRPTTSTEWREVRTPKTAEEIDTALRDHRQTPESAAAPWIRTERGATTFAGYSSYQGFHSLRCALAFAVAAHHAGYRISRV